jgi:predicted ferric reductase
VYQWHPFTLTSSPHDGYLSVHIRAVGDWTKAFAKRVGCNFDDNLTQPPKTLPYILVDGGYGNYSKELFEFETVILVGAGIGVTPYAPILKSLKNMEQTMSLKARKLTKVYFYWICSDKQSFEWFHEVLSSLEETTDASFFEIRIFLTQPLKLNEQHNIIVNDGVGGVDAVTVFLF